MDELKQLTVEKESLEINHSSSARVKSQMRKKLKIIGGHVKELETGLTAIESDPVHFAVGKGELSRRYNLMKQLEREVSEVQSAVDGGRRRNELFENAASRSRGPAQETAGTSGRSDQQLYNQHHESLQRQDEQLDSIQHGIHRIKVLGENIGDELEVQNALLGEVDDSMENVDRRLKENTRGITDLMRKDSSRMGFCVILLLLVLIVV